MENTSLSIIEFMEKSYPEGLPQEIIFYGGSFNPWHDGHREALKRVSGSHVIVIPDRNPLKSINPFGLEENEGRILSALSENQILYTGFLRMRTHNPTQVWIQKIRAHFPQLEIGLLMGFDNFSILDRWHESHRLINDLDRIYILSRNDNEVVKMVQCEKLSRMNHKIDFVFLGNHSFEDVSSTLIREQLALNNELHIFTAI